MKNAIWNIFIIFSCLIRTKVLGLQCYGTGPGESPCAKQFEENSKYGDITVAKRYFLECQQNIDPIKGECTGGFTDKCLRATLKFGDQEVIYVGCDSNSDSICNQLKDRTWPFEKPLDKDSSKCDYCTENLCNKKEGISKSDDDKKNDDDKSSSDNDKIKCYHVTSKEIVDCKTFECLKQLVDGPGTKTGCEECSHAIFTYENDEKPINIPFCDQEGAIKCHSFKDNPKNFEHLGFNGTKTVKSSVCESCKKELCMREERSKGTRYEFSNAFMLISTAAVILYFYKPF